MRTTYSLFSLEFVIWYTGFDRDRQPWEPEIETISAEPMAVIILSRLLSGLLRFILERELVRAA
ncbi:MAG: hypothetical protein KA714_16245 [Limnoraphis sp. WC205]|nr:hypothetical protein [Limnoraphis sp. WC205]